MTPRFHAGSESKYSLSLRSASEASHAADAASFELIRAWNARSSASLIADASCRSLAACLFCSSACCLSCVFLAAAAARLQKRIH